MAVEKAELKTCSSPELGLSVVGEELGKRKLAVLSDWGSPVDHCVKRNIWSQARWFIPGNQYRYHVGDGRRLASLGTGFDLEFGEVYA